MINITELSKLSGLQEKFIRRCMTELHEIIEKYK